MINKEFIAETDRLIEKFKSRKIETQNANLIVAKVKADKVTKGGLFLPDDATTVDDFHNGLARIVAVAGNADAQYKPGLYIIHAHESRYKIFDDALREVLAHLVDKDTIYSVQDNNVIFTIPAEVLHADV